MTCAPSLVKVPTTPVKQGKHIPTGYIPNLAPISTSAHKLHINNTRWVRIRESRKPSLHFAQGYDDGKRLWQFSV